MPTRPDSAPEFLTVPEAAAMLRLGRTQAYELTRIYRATQGTAGLPVNAIGRRLIVPRAALHEFASTTEQNGSTR